jgi:hypothetical protein
MRAPAYVVHSYRAITGRTQEDCCRLKVRNRRSGFDFKICSRGCADIPASAVSIRVNGGGVDSAEFDKLGADSYSGTLILQAQATP